MVKEIYTRKLSTTEVKEGYILILKDKLRLFPEPGGSFTLRVKEQEFTTQIIETPCTCRGQDKPHVHWHLDASGFMNLLPGDRPKVTVSKTEGGVYKLEIARS